MLQVFAELTAGKQPDDQLDLRIRARRVSHRESTERTCRGNLDVDELAGGKPHPRRADQAKRDATNRGGQVRDTVDDGVEGFDPVTGKELLPGQAHRRDVDDTVGQGPARTR